MLRKTLYLLLVVIAMLDWAGVAAQGQRGPGEAAALQGVVSSEAEGQMEGVLVSARKVGGTITVTVVSDSQGRYRFPANRLEPGKHRLSIRGAGYDLATPSEIEISPSKPTQLDLALTETKDLASQLMNAEWLMSVEKAGKGKQIEKLDCVGCHSLTRIFTSKHSTESWVTVLDRMRTYGQGGRKLPFPVPPRAPDHQFAEFLSSINLSSGDQHTYQLQMLPRPKGRATRVVITEYDLPDKTSEPHEVLVAPDGMIWYADFVRPYMVKLNPTTGAFTEYRLPDLKPGFPAGSNCFEIDTQGNLWLGGLKQGGAYKLDRKTEKITSWKLPFSDSPYSHAGCLAVSPDGSVWVRETGSGGTSIQYEHRLDPKTGRFTNYIPFPDDMTIVPAKNRQPQGTGYLGGFGDLSYQEEGTRKRRHQLYGSSIDSKGIYYLADIGAGHIVKMNPETKAVTLYETPTPDSGPRRMDMDSQDRLWFAEYRAGKIGVFDTKTFAFKEWPIPTPYAGPYDVKFDKNGDVWAGGMHTDYLYRLNSNTGEVTQYLLPTVNVNIRNMGGVDNRTTPTTVWIGENHRNKIARVEPLD